MVYEMSEIEFADTIINKDGYRINESLVDAIRDFPEPTTISEMRSFNRLAQQLAPYDPHLAKLSPLRHSLKKTNQAFLMTDVEKHSFTQVKELLSSPQILAYYSPGQPVELYTYAACKSGFGFILKQRQIDGRWKPIITGSRALTHAEQG